MEQRYQPQSVEPKWQAFWKENKAFKVKKDTSKEKYYLLEMFPYPSGKIHIGHVRNYTIGDVVVRYKRMKGFNVIHPMGWDAFGMPAENAAIDNNTHPAAWTYENINAMREQLKKMGFSYDWDREIATCHPEYYRWEQWLFLKMLEKKMAYRKESYVNWCEKCQTVLANEQVEQDKCWRCSQTVQQKKLWQWFFKITDFAEDLLIYCDKLPGWPDKVTTMQKNWIGRSVGSELKFKIHGKDEDIVVFTTRPDTVFGATFMCLAPEHPLVETLSRGTDQEEQVKTFVKKISSQERSAEGLEKYDKEGVFTGVFCINPATGKKIPVYTANFVLMEYGTGAIMSVPAGDQRDFDFARKYNLEIIPVVQPEGEEFDGNTMEEAYTGEGVIVNSGKFNGLGSSEAMDVMTAWLEKKGRGKKTISFRLRDWGISRQRYWGAPIPIIHCSTCGAVPDRDLPVELPAMENFEPDDTGRSPLARVEEWVNTICPVCGGPAERDTDTMAGFVCSSWYFLRFTSPFDTERPFSPEAVKYWLPVDLYVGGAEHAVMHLIYARFWTKVMHDEGMLDFTEPFSILKNQGMILGADGQKMSKSKGNIVTPDEMVEKFGADALRLYILFMGPFEAELDWSEDGIAGTYSYRCQRT